MNCLKCGQEVAAGQVFCDECLKDMERHPVNPGTPVILPKRSKPLPIKRTHRKIQKPEDQIAALRRMAGWMALIIFVLLVAIALLTGTMLHFRKLAQPRMQPLAAAEIVSRETIFDNIC